MSCNKDGRRCQPAGDAVGSGDTELIQMTGRRKGGNCPTCGQFLPLNGGHTCPPHITADDSGIITALNKAIEADERRPFIVVDGMEQYFPVAHSSLEEQVAQLQRVTAQDGSVAALYRYDSHSHPANDPRKPVAIYSAGRPAMVTAEAQSAVDAIDWRNTGWAVHDIMDRLDRQEEIPTAGKPAEVFNQLGQGRQSEQLRCALDRTRETVETRADEGVGLTAKDARPLWGAYLTELDRRIEEKAAPAMTAVYGELGRDYWQTGYTEPEVNTGCEKLNDLARNVFGLPGEIGVMWQENDDVTGFGGDSELVYIRQVPGDEWGSSKVETYSLSSPFLEDSNPDDFIADLRRIARREATPDAVYSGDEVTCDDYNWGPWQEEEILWEVEQDEWEANL